ANSPKTRPIKETGIKDTLYWAQGVIPLIPHDVARKIACTLWRFLTSSLPKDLYHLQDEILGSGSTIITQKTTQILILLHSFDAFYPQGDHHALALA
ncbi:hypothetical protein, partial [Citrobacter braakii]|uniref:hypothetical protein n=1 Tax=Citrobacter braakii TaxID=57706 RepID=UPI001C8CDD5D